MGSQTLEAEYVLDLTIDDLNHQVQEYLVITYILYDEIPASETEPYEPAEPASVIITSAEIRGRNVLPVLDLFFEEDELEDYLLERCG